MLKATFKNITMANFEGKQGVLKSFHTNQPFQVHGKASYKDIIHGITMMYLAKKTKDIAIPCVNLDVWGRDMINNDLLTLRLYTNHDFEYYAHHEEDYLWLPEAVVQIHKELDNKLLAAELDKWEG